MTEGQTAAGGILEECEGTAYQPIAEEGFLCVYNSAFTETGSRESEWKEAGFYALQDLGGQSDVNAVNMAGRESESSQGELVVFRTKTFNVTGKPATLTTAASATADGIWAVRAK